MPRFLMELHGTSSRNVDDSLTRKREYSTRFSRETSKFVL
jgi:hypothetical protein